MKLVPMAMAIILAGILLTCTLTASAHDGSTGRADSNWPMFQHDVRHTGQSPYVGIVSSPLVQWVKQLPGNCGESGKGISQARDSTVYIAACGVLSAVDPVDGAIKWTFSGGSSRSTPVVAADGTIYWGYGDSLVALTASGEVDWQQTDLSMNYIFGSSPALTKDGSIVFSHDGLFSFAQDGSFEWVYPFSWYSHASPAIGADGTIYIGSGDNNFYAFSPAGNMLWQRAIVTYDSSASIGSDGTVYIGTYRAKLYAFQPDGTEQWVFESDETRYSDSAVFAPPAIGQDGTIYFGTHVCCGGVADYAHIYAINPDGSLKWKFPVPRREVMNPGVVAPLTIDKENNLFACADNGSCYGFAADGTLLWEYGIRPNTEIRTAPYIVADGNMLILAERGFLYKLVAATDQAYLPLILSNSN
ncbi:MAG: PQQ-binding-like beta-propeller repeat protein [Chloroflexi bacterium]|nr:PQQ-binding-like beta-propeller repeat protein [Chloroflexota bacterium]